MTTEEKFEKSVNDCQEFDSGPTYAPPKKKRRGGAVGTRTRVPNPPKHGTSSMTPDSSNDLAIYLRENIAKLTTANEELKNNQIRITELHEQHKVIIQNQADQLEQLRKTNEMQQNSIADLEKGMDIVYYGLIDETKKLSIVESDLDELQQDKLRKNLTISGPAIARFIKDTPEFKEKSRKLGFHSLNRLKEKLAESALPPCVSPSSNPNVENPEEIPLISIDSQPHITEQDSELVQAYRDSVKIMTDKQGVASARIIRDDLLCVDLNTEDNKYEFFSIAKKVRQDFIFAEQLTKRRQTIMWRLREFRREFPSLQLSVFSRNTFPVVRFGRVHNSTGLRANAIARNLLINTVPEIWIGLMIDPDHTTRHLHVKLMHPRVKTKHPIPFI